MPATLLRPRVQKRLTVEALCERHNELVFERQALRSAGAGSAALEQNRLKIVRCQWELAHALIDRHSAAPAVAA
jgi:hypothetical protein